MNDTVNQLQDINECQTVLFQDLNHEESID